MQDDTKVPHWDSVHWGLHRASDNKTSDCQ